MSMTISGLGMSAMPQAMTGASMRMPPSQKMSNLFAMMDAAGSGNVTKAQFEQAFSQLNPPAGFKAMGADAVFAKLDPGNSGKVTKSDFVSGMTQMMSEIRQQHHHHHASATQQAQTVQASMNGLNQLIGSNINIQA